MKSQNTKKKKVYNPKVQKKRRKNLVNEKKKTNTGPTRNNNWLAATGTTHSLERSFTPSATGNNNPIKVGLLGPCRRCRMLNPLRSIITKYATPSSTTAKKNRLNKILLLVKLKLRLPTVQRRKLEY